MAKQTKKTVIDTRTNAEPANWTKIEGGAELKTFKANAIHEVTLADVGFYLWANAGRELEDSYGDPAAQLAQPLTVGWDAVRGVAKGVDIVSTPPKTFDYYLPVYGRVTEEITPDTLKDAMFQAIRRVDLRPAPLSITIDNVEHHVQPSVVSALMTEIYTHNTPTIWVISAQRRLSALFWTVQALIQAKKIKHWSKYKIPVYVVPFTSHDEIRAMQITDNSQEGKLDYADESHLANAVTLLRQDGTLSEANLSRKAGTFERRGLRQKCYRWAQLEVQFTGSTPSDDDLRLVDRCMMRKDTLVNGKPAIDHGYFDKEGARFYKPKVGPLNFRSLDKEDAQCLLEGTDNDNKGGKNARQIRGNDAIGLATQDEIENTLALEHGFGAKVKTDIVRPDMKPDKIKAISTQADFKDAPITFDDVAKYAAGEIALKDIKPKAIGPNKLAQIADAVGQTTAPVADVIKAILSLDVAYFERLAKPTEPTTPAKSTARKRSK